MGQISIARGVVAIDPTSAPGGPLYTDVTSPQVLYSGTGGLISGSASFEWINSTSSLELGTGAELYVYNTADKTTNYERGVAKWDTNAYVIGTEKGGTGSARTLNFQVDGTSRWYITTAGHFLTTSSNGYDIGASGSLVRSLYYGTSLDGSSGATFNLYNTADQTTNYERLRAEFSGNIASLYMQRGGTGIDREFRIVNAAVAYIRINPSAPFLRLGNGGGNLATATVFSNLGEWGVTAASGTQTIAAISPNINQSGTAGYIALDINPTETATGSGTKLLQRWAMGGTALATMTNGGVSYAQWVIALTSIGFATSLGGSADVTLNRDAADTLALRRSTIAQTFRVYNTYTDGSNYERGVAQWSASDFQVGTQAAGTGVGRNLTFIVNGTGAWRISSSGGHFLAVSDGVYDIGASGANRPRNLYLSSTVVALRYYSGLDTVATLPLASAGRGRTFVSDSTVAAAGNFGNIVAGGGANIVPVYSDGTNWRIG